MELPVIIKCIFWEKDGICTCTIFGQFKSESDTPLMSQEAILTDPQLEQKVFSAFYQHPKFCKDGGFFKFQVKFIGRKYFYVNDIF